MLRCSGDRSLYDICFLNFVLSHAAWGLQALPVYLRSYRCTCCVYWHCAATMSCSGEANLEKSFLPEDPWRTYCALLLCSSLFACNDKIRSNMWGGGIEMLYPPQMIWKLTLVGRAYDSFLQSRDISLLVEKNLNEQGQTAYWNHTDQSCLQDFHINTLHFSAPLF
jgi:hypothetical protein